jgi:hypothetical protein
MPGATIICAGEDPGTRSLSATDALPLFSHGLVERSQAGGEFGAYLALST